ncbi:MAG: hypothetical protein LBJ00_08015 [Planctomycetaceae bacterium]|nr:hypothetical protein [Planctomycetaceae bacterium]
MSIITGIVYDISGKPVAGAVVALASKRFSPYIKNGMLSDNDSDFVTSTNSKGQFTLPEVDSDDVADKVLIQQVDKIHQPNDKTNQPTDKTKEADYKLVAENSKLIPDEYKAETDENVLRKLYAEWDKTENGKKSAEIHTSIEKLLLKVDRLAKESKEADMQNLYCVVDSDGKFRLEDVPAGDWNLIATLYLPPFDGQVYPPRKFCSVSQSITVPETPEGKPATPIQLGTLTIEKPK